MKGMRFVIREDEDGPDAKWVKDFSVRPTDIDCTDMSDEEFADLYESKRAELTR